MLPLQKMADLSTRVFEMQIAREGGAAGVVSYSFDHTWLPVAA